MQSLSYLENPSSIVIDRDNVGYVVLFQLRDVLGVCKVAYEQSRDHLRDEYFPENSFFPFVYLLDNSQRDPFYPVALGNVWKCRYLLPPPQPKSSSHSFNKQLASMAKNMGGTFQVSHSITLSKYAIWVSRISLLQSVFLQFHISVCVQRKYLSKLIWARTNFTICNIACNWQITTITIPKIIWIDCKGCTARFQNAGATGWVEDRWGSSIKYIIPNIYQKSFLMKKKAYSPPYSFLGCSRGSSSHWEGAVGSSCLELLSFPSYFGRKFSSYFQEKFFSYFRQKFCSHLLQSLLSRSHNHGGSRQLPM